MKTIKIIDLYNIIAKGQTPPKRIRYQGLIFNWDSEKYLHYSNEFSRERNLLEGIVTEMCLNNEVEIIEEKPEKIDEEQYFYNYAEYDKNQHELDKVLYIIRALNRLEEKCSDNAKVLNYLLEKSDKDE